MRPLGRVCTGVSLALLIGSVANAEPPAISVGSAGVLQYLEPGQPPVVIHPTVEWARQHAGHGHGPGGGGGGGSKNLVYNGGVSGIGVETAPRVYLILWGSQWNGGDPSGEATILNDFLSNVGGSSWLNSVTQYCQGVASGTEFCNGGSGTAAGNQAGMFQGVWYDTGSPAPSRPHQSDLAAEAVRAAAYFGNTGAGSNDSAQYVIATASRDNPQGFGRQYCAWHSYTSSTYGNVAYTNLPYITDAGASCGAGFNNLGAKAGITIVEGHELGETITDQFPAGGWLDSGSAENGDKCAWISSGQGAAASVSLNGVYYPVQSLWSNAFNNNGGGCVLSY